MRYYIPFPRSKEDVSRDVKRFVGREVPLEQVKINRLNFGPHKGGYAWEIKDDYFIIRRGCYSIVFISTFAFAIGNPYLYKEGLGIRWGEQVITLRSYGLDLHECAVNFLHKILSFSPIRDNLRLFVSGNKEEPLNFVPCRYEDFIAPILNFLEGPYNLSEEDPFNIGFDLL